MPVHYADTRLAEVAAAIAEPARARMLCALMDGRARTSTELAAIAEVTASTASTHLSKLRDQELVQVVAQGKHRYYQLAGEQVAAAIEALLHIAAIPTPNFAPTTPQRLRQARTCYDHLAGEIAVGVHDAMLRKGWLRIDAIDSTQYAISEQGHAVFSEFGWDLSNIDKSRRKKACACLDWSERKPHLGGALGALMLRYAMQQQWFEADLEGRALSLTSKGKRQLMKLFDFVPQT
jgi:DNA-binding transcriptional ArsR family regulator